MQTAAPWAGSKWLTYWTSETVYWAVDAGPLQPHPPSQQLDQGSDSQYVARRRRDLHQSEWNWSKQMMCDHVSCHHVVQGLVKHWACGKASDRSRRGHQCCETSLTGEPSSIVGVGASLER